MSISVRNLIQNFSVFQLNRSCLQLDSVQEITGRCEGMMPSENNWVGQMQQQQHSLHQSCYNIEYLSRLLLMLAAFVNTLVQSHYCHRHTGFRVRPLINYQMEHFKKFQQQQPAKLIACENTNVAIKFCCKLFQSTPSAYFHRDLVAGCHSDDS